MKAFTIVDGFGLFVMTAVLALLANLSEESRSLPPQASWRPQAGVDAPVPTEVLRRISPYSCETYKGTEYPCSYDEAQVRGYGSGWAECGPENRCGARW